ncbi:beta-lactamase-like protein 2 homolog [Phlebotomus argentipes]|uniref:beta-lactamase-like protein 2 homolog n=1 Tax=Phlebotomus argentipes TaxID=94469 RepID=UPI0028936EA9|nr:beta-lactamase-like protein 2 homolog [Phlebotomus argentipes]
MAMSAATHLPVIPAVTKISQSIIRILGCNPGKMTLQGTNTYLIGSGRKRLLLDAGEPDKPKFIENLRKVLKEENVAIENILITHWHNDHLGGVKDVLEISEAKDCKVWKFPRTDAEDSYQNLPASLKLLPLRDGQRFAVEGATIEVIHTPGHTTDHVVVSHEESGALFSGDCILGDATTVFEDLYDYMKSLEKILQLEPTVIYPAHGSIIENPNDRIKYYIMHRKKREEAICELLKTKKTHLFTELDIVKNIYKDTPTEMWPAAAYNVNHHLKKLAKEGKVVESEKDGQNVWQFSDKNSVL